MRYLVMILSWGLLTATVSWASPLGSADRPLNMMFVPSGEAQVILEGGDEIGRRLHRLTGLHFKTTVATSYAAVIEAMGAGKVDIGWLPPFSYVLAKNRYDVDLLFIVRRFGSSFYRGQIITRADSGLRSLKDLKGKRFAFVDPASTSGHLYPKTLFLKQGLNPETFLGSMVFAGSHNGVLFAVMKGEVDAGATYDDIRAEVVKKYPDVFDRIRVIAYTKEIPNDTVCARRDLDPSLKQKFKEGLIKLSQTPDGAKLLKKVYAIGGLMDFDGFFDSVRESGRLLDLELQKPKP